MAEVTCSECKKQTTVPFTPTPGKPVYCDECFRKKRESGPRGGPGGRGGGGSGGPRRGGFGREPVRQKAFSRSDYPGFEKHKEN